MRQALGGWRGERPGPPGSSAKQTSARGGSGPRRRGKHVKAQAVFRVETACARKPRGDSVVRSPTGASVRRRLDASPRPSRPRRPARPSTAGATSRAFLHFGVARAGEELLAPARGLLDHRLAALVAELAGLRAASRASPRAAASRCGTSGRPSRPGTARAASRLHDHLRAALVAGDPGRLRLDDVALRRRPRPCSCTWGSRCRRGSARGARCGSPSACRTSRRRGRSR